MNDDLQARITFLENVIKDVIHHVENETSMGGHVPVAPEHLREVLALPPQSHYTDILDSPFEHSFEDKGYLARKLVTKKEAPNEGGL